MFVVFFFKQKTAYEMRISDWSSDVCSSDLGSIQVRVWDKPEVHIGGSLGRGVDTFDIRGDRDELEIIVRYPRVSNDSSEPTDLVIDVPTLASLDIDGVAVEISVIGTAGRSLEIDSVSGDIT